MSECIWIRDNYVGGMFDWKPGCRPPEQLFTGVDFPRCPYCGEEIERRDLFAEFKEWREFVRPLPES